MPGYMSISPGAGSPRGLLILFTIGIGDTIGAWHAISVDIMAGIITEFIGMSVGRAEVVGVQSIASPGVLLDAGPAHSWIRGKGRVSAEALSGSGASRVVKISCWSARRARREAHGLMEEAGNGMAHMPLQQQDRCSRGHTPDPN